MSSPDGEDGRDAAALLFDPETGSLAWDAPSRPPPAELAALPNPPSWELVNAAHVPPPPRLNEEHDPSVWAQALVDAYRGAVVSRFKHSHPFPRATLSKKPFYPLLIKGAEALIDYEIAPASWAAWSCDVWRRYGAKGKPSKKPPHLTWVWSPSRIQERHGWFRNEEGGYGGGRLVIGPALRALLDRYYDARRRVFGGEPAAVALPPEEWLKLVDAAKVEADDYRHRMANQVRAGLWLW